MSYTIDQQRRLVLTRAWGVISAGNIQAASSRIRTDPDFDSEYRRLTDLSEATEITAESIVAFDVARMFASFAARTGQQVQVFREMRETEVWLEL